MRRHYLKLPTTIQTYYPGGAPEDWRLRAFDDATEKGTKLICHPLPGNDLGPRLALFGDDFYFEVGRDRGRSDTLFVTRIEYAKSPSKAPTTVACWVRVWPGGVPGTLDDVGNLFAGAAEGSGGSSTAVSGMEPQVR